MNVEYVNPFLSSLVNVLSTMANTTIVPGQPRIKKDEVARGDVSGLIGMIGPQTKGSFSVTFEESLALEIMFRMLGEKRVEATEMHECNCHDPMLGRTAPCQHVLVHGERDELPQVDVSHDIVQLPRGVGRPVG